MQTNQLNIERNNDRLKSLFDSQLNTEQLLLTLCLYVVLMFRFLTNPSFSSFTLTMSCLARSSTALKDFYKQKMKNIYTISLFIYNFIYSRIFNSLLFSLITIIFTFKSFMVINEFFIVFTKIINCCFILIKIKN